MPVFIVTDRNGKQSKLIAKSRAEAGQAAASQLQQPGALLQIRQVDTGGQSDQKAFGRLPIPEVTQASLSTVDTQRTRLAPSFGRPNTQVQVDPIAGQQNFLRNDGSGAVASTGRIGQSGNFSEDVSTFQGAMASQLPPNVLGVAPGGGVRFGPSQNVGAAASGAGTPAETKGIFEFTRRDGSQVRVIAWNEEEAKAILVARGDAGPGQQLNLVRVSETDGNAPSGFLSDNSAARSGSGTGSGSGSGTGSGAGGVSGVVPPVDGDPSLETFASGSAGEIGSQFDRENIAPDAAFRNFLRGQGVAPGGTGGGFLQPIQPVASNLYGALSDFGLLPENTTFSQFLGELGKGQGIGRPALSELARQTLQDQRFQFGDEQEIFGDGGTFTRDAQNLANLGSIGGGQSFGFGLRPTAGQFENQLRDRTVAGQDITPAQFLQLLKTSFGRRATPGSNAGVNAVLPGFSGG